MNRKNLCAYSGKCWFLCTIQDKRKKNLKRENLKQKKNIKLNLKCTKNQKRGKSECIFFFICLMARKSKWMLKVLYVFNATIWMVCILQNAKNICTLAVTNDFRLRITFSLWTRTPSVLCHFTHKNKSSTTLFPTPILSFPCCLKNASTFFYAYFLLPNQFVLCAHTKWGDSLNAWSGTRRKLDSRFLLMAPDCSGFCLFGMVSSDIVHKSNFGHILPSICWALRNVF